MRTAIAAFILSAFLLGAPTSPAHAQGANFGDAVAAFNNAQYPVAADMFMQVLRQTPNDALAHYYLGLTWHYLGRVNDARSEYAWVKANSPDPELQRRVEVGLQAISRIQPAGMPTAMQVPTPTPPSDLPPQVEAMRQQMAAMQASDRFAPAATAQQGYQQPVSYTSQPGYQPAFGQPSPGTTSGATGWLSGAGQQRAAQAVGGSSQLANVGQQGRIVDLYTTWCGWCKRFEPIFEQAQAKYGNVLQFQRVNAELPQYSHLVKKYKVRGYPTVLLFDSSGKLVERVNGAPQSLQDFEATIFSAYPALRQNQPY